MNGLIIAYTGNIYLYSCVTKLVNYEHECCEVNKYFRIYSHRMFCCCKL